MQRLHNWGLRIFLETPAASNFRELAENLGSTLCLVTDPMIQRTIAARVILTLSPALKVFLQAARIPEAKRRILAKRLLRRCF